MVADFREVGAQHKLRAFGPTTATRATAMARKAPTRNISNPAHFRRPSTTVVNPAWLRETRYWFVGHDTQLASHPPDFGALLNMPGAFGPKVSSSTIRPF
jgi:hypothetical protein